MEAKVKKGLSLIELMIAVAILGILAKLGISLYFDQIKRSNKTTAIQVLHQNVNKMEQYYSQKGRYLESNNTWPGNVITSVVGINGSAVYSISYYPAQASTANQQAFCLLASPVGNISQSYQYPIYINRYGKISSTPPDDCSFNSVTTPSLCPAGGAFPPCSGDCSNGGPYSACSGHCSVVTVCNGGCSGSCSGSIIYGSCSGSCQNSFIKNNCSGSCSGSTVCGSCSGSCSGVNKNGC